MAEPTTSVAAGIGAILVKVFPGALGSLVSLWFVGEGLGWKQRAMSFAAGVVTAYYIGPLVIWFAHATEDSQKMGVGFAVGLFGLAITKELFKEINNADLIGTLKRRFFGRGE
ncbi:holin [Burkholderia plantarii]|uniref:holin n=1 Tax=Burkholderia plantarii TaxID=41899 RepID=UPI0018DD8FF3|nr:holin [Burkholderia plantarii]MBI0325556.1 holin [Burkholderia plantarii]